MMSHVSIVQWFEYDVYPLPPQISPSPSMEGASVSVLVPYRPTNLTTLTSKLKPQFLKFLSPTNRTLTIILPRCSTNPNKTDPQNSIKQNHATVSHSRTQPLEPSGESLSSVSSSSIGLIFDLGHRHSWDGLEIGSPVVKRYLSDEEERWYMWYHGKSGENSDSIGLAVSSNGIHWARDTHDVRSNADAGLVMSSSKDWWAFDTHGIRPSEVMIMSSSKIRSNTSVYWLYYTGFCSEKMESLDQHKSLPGLAMSQDGRNWARIEGEHHSGALFDAGGSNGQWDSMFIASPHVVPHGAGDLRMYYHSLDAETGSSGIGIARSRDGMKWIKLGKILGRGEKGAFDELGVVNPRVVRNQRDCNYLMVYQGVDSTGKTSIGIGASRDGLKEWRRLQEHPILEASHEGGWDSEGVGFPYLVQMSEHEWRLYYTGIGKEGKTGIGLAISHSGELQNFQRWTGFHL